MSDLGISITIKAGGINEFQAKLKKIDQKLSNIDSPMKEAGEIARALVRSYPPYGNWQSGQVSFMERYPGAKYKRTRTLQRAWKGQLRKGSRVLFTYRVYNYGTIEERRGKPYLKYVQGEEQTVPHIGRWYTNEDMKPMIQAETSKIFERFMRGVART